MKNGKTLKHLSFIAIFLIVFSLFIPVANAGDEKDIAPHMPSCIECGGGDVVNYEGTVALYMEDCVLSPRGEHWHYIKGLHLVCANCNAYNGTLRIDKQSYVCTANKHFGAYVR